MSALTCCHCHAYRRLVSYAQIATWFHIQVNRSDPSLRLFSVCCLAVVVLTGCAQERWARLRQVPLNPLTKELRLESRKGPRPTDRTLQMLRRYDLVELWEGDRINRLVESAQVVADREPIADNVYAVAELAYIAAKRSEENGHEDLSLDHYGIAVVNSYLYLFDPSFDNGRNPYDPRFRRACDLYNVALEGSLRIINRRGQLQAGKSHLIETANNAFEFSIAARGDWHEDNVGELRFVSDFEVNDLTNEYHTFGMGVPMVATYRQRPEYPQPAEAFYPPGMSFSVTAFLRVNETESTLENGKTRHRCVIELYDPMDSSDIIVNRRFVPLQTDITTPLAYGLDNPAFKRANSATLSLRRPDETAGARGLYMLEPYDPDKIPVVMIHGVWSSLITWMEMFNDLRGTPDIRERYQFWFYLYPSGEPFWFTAAHLRSDLTRMRDTLDRSLYATPLDKTVLIGHSMGGLVAKLQTMHSGNEFWELVSDKPLSELHEHDHREQLGKTFYFEPNPSVHRVVTIATPHRGSNASNNATQWLGRKIINVPAAVEASRMAPLRNHPDFFSETSLLRRRNSVEALAADSPVLPVILQGQTAEWVRYHNIVGLVDDMRVIGKVAEGTDGVVTYESAHLDNVDSEVIVAADHTNVHRSPKAVLEVRRILREHLATLEGTSPDAPVAFPIVPQVSHVPSTIR